MNFSSSYYKIKTKSCAKNFSMMQNEVHILFEGYSFEDSSNSNYMRANCSCTLVKMDNGLNIVVDTMTAWDGENIISALKEHNLGPDDISVVVCTHGHSDHIGCNYLFPKAIWHFVGECASKGDQYLVDWSLLETQAVPDTFQLNGNSAIVEKTPGHTMSCVSVVVRNTNLGKVVGICGDLFERREDVFDDSIWLGAGSESHELQRKHRLRIAEMCDYIIPGHGPGFHVTEEIRVALNVQIKNC